MKPIVLCFKSFPVARSLWIRKGDIKVFRRKVFVSQCQKFSQGKPSVPCFRRFPVAENFWIGEGGHKDFPYSFFVSQCLKVPAGGILKCFISFRYRKTLDKRGG